MDIESRTNPIMSSIFSKKVFFLLFLTILSLDTGAVHRIYDYKRKPIKLVLVEKKIIKILSIDGGGVRGLLPLRILENIESRLKRKKNITPCFDIMAGTSAGGIAVLMLNIPLKGGEAKYKASDLPSIYKNFVKKVFGQTLWHKIVTFNGWVGDKYDPTNLESALKEFFGDLTLKNSLKDVVICSYDISKNANLTFFKRDALESEVKNYYFKDIARATSAAPAYFPPAKINNVYQTVKHVLVDGGISSNNPTVNAIVHALELYGRHIDFLIISLGTGTTYGARRAKNEYDKMDKNNPGKIGWIEEIIPLSMHSVNEMTDYQIQHILPNDRDSSPTYYRIQITIEPQFSDLDNISDQNIEALERYAKELITQNEEKLKQISSLLDS